MLAKRIIPCLDVLNGKVVKGIKFDIQNYSWDAVELARKYYEQGADELVFLDIGATPENRKTLINLVEQVSEQIFIPFTVGGGIRKISDIKKILRAGADKVSINTAAVENPNLIKTAAKKFGSQCIVVAIDAQKGVSSWEVLINSGKTKTGLDAIEWVQKVASLGAGEILLTSFDSDGTKKGYNLDLTRKISENVGVPVIASGGAGSAEDIYKVLTSGKADAALAASIFHFSETTVQDIKNYLRQKGVVVR